MKKTDLKKMEMRFYHLDRQGLEHVLPSLVAKALEKGHRIIIRTNSDQQAERLSEHLWVHDPESFIPHGTKKDGHADRQPVYLTHGNDNPNNADMLILTDGAATDGIEDFPLCCAMLDGRSEESVNAARAQWKIYKDRGLDVTYWQQGDKGWQKKS